MIPAPSPSTTAIHPMRTTLRTALAAATLGALSSSCVMHSHATDWNGVDGVRGVPVELQTTTSWALHGLFVFPLIGDGGKAYVVDEFTKEAAARGAARTRITQTGGLTYWFIFPPLSFLIHPVQTTVEGTIEVE